MGTVSISDFNYTRVYMGMVWITECSLPTEEFFFVHPPVCTVMLQNRPMLVLSSSLKCDGQKSFLKEETWKNVNWNYRKRANGYSFILVVFYEAKWRLVHCKGYTCTDTDESMITLNSSSSCHLKRKNYFFLWMFSLNFRVIGLGAPTMRFR